MIQKLVLGVLGVVWSVLFFMIGMHLTFPGETARDRLIYEVDNNTRGSMQLQLDDVSPWRGTGLTLVNARLLTVDKPRRGQEAGPAALVLAAQEVSARVHLFSLLTRPAATVQADLYGGEIGGVVAQDDQAVVLDLTGRDLDLALYPFEGEDYSLDLGGKLLLRADLVYDASEVKNSEGKLRFEVKGLKLGEGSKAMGFELPSATFSEAVLSFDVAKGKASIKKGEFASDLLDLELDGDITLSAPFTRSRLGLGLSLDVHDEALDSMLGMVAGKAKGSDGAYKAALSGTLERPSFRWESKSSSRSSSRTGNRPPPPGVDDAGLKPPPPDDEADREDRRSSRQDRIRDRRERLRAEREGEAKRPSSGDDEGEFDEGGFDEGEFDEIEFEDGEFDEGDFDEFEGDFDIPAPIEPAAGGPPGGDERVRGLPEPEYDDVPPPDFSNDHRPGE